MPQICPAVPLIRFSHVTFKTSTNRVRLVVCRTLNRRRNVCCSWRVHPVALGLILIAASSGCSLKKVAINKLGDALAGSGDTFSSDDDPELIESAVPFSLKLLESLLAESPNHRGMLIAAS